jgi:hypothetical protein
MPNIAPLVIPKYRTRILIKATSQTKRYWTEYRIVTFIASPILAAIWPWHGLTLTTFALIVFRAVLIFFVIWCVTFFYSLLRAPALIDSDTQEVLRRQNKTISDNDAALDEKEKVIKTLEMDVDDLKKPKRAALDEKTYQHYKAILAGYGDVERAVLWTLKNNGRMTEKTALGLYPVPDGLTRERAGNALGRLLADKVVTRDHQQNIGEQILTWQIAPGAIDAINDWL